MEEYLNNLMWRYATKKFDPQQKLGAAEIDMLEEALRLSPNSYGLQAWRFYRIDDPTIRIALRAAGYDQSQITDASHLYALASRTTLDEGDVNAYIDLIKAIREVDDAAVDGFRKMLSGSLTELTPDRQAAWTAKQVYIALGFLLNAAAQHHIDACPMEGFDSAKVSEIIGATKEGYAVQVLCPVGHRAVDDKYAALKKVRYPKEKVVKVI
jgi:nitroreductase